ncbi:secretion protein [Salinisphaera sp. PC39]|uniref:efflux RND transporter periplasmic adaptor subunit n=1 Tax=Salinisphaera sp. PC39 TaxID=1304156 RepID=UPI00334244C3
MRKRMLIVIVALVVVFGGVFGWKAFVGYQIDQFLANMEPPPVTVGTVELDTAEWQKELRVTGELRAVRGVAVSTELAGVVRRIEFESGDTVAAGDLLVALDTSADRAELEGLRADAELARVTYERKKRLRERDLGSAAAFDEARATYDQARAAVAAQEAVIAKKEIRAPFDGRLGIRQVDLGQYVGPGAEMVSLQALDPIYIDFNVPQKRVSDIVVGERVAVEVAGYEGRFEGEVQAVSPALDRGTRTFRVRARVANPDERLRPGMYGNVELTLGEPQSYLTVRQTAISYNPYGDGVWVVVEKEGEDGETRLVAERRTVKTGDTRGDQVQILDGLDAGARVVVVGHHKLRSGARVKIDNENLPENEADPENVDNY